MRYREVKKSLAYALLLWTISAGVNANEKDDENIQSIRSVLESISPINPAVVFLPTCSDAAGDVQARMCETFNDLMRLKLARGGSRIEIRNHRQRWRAIDPDFSNLDLSKYKYIILFRGPIASKATHSWVVESFAHIHFADDNETYIGRMSKQEQSASFGLTDINHIIDTWTTAYSRAILDKKCPTTEKKVMSPPPALCNYAVDITIRPEKRNPFFK